MSLFFELLSKRRTSIAAQVPIFGFFGAVFLPLPTLFYRIKAGRQTGAAIVAAATTLFVALGGGLSPDVFFFIDLLVVGFLLGELFLQRLSVEQTVVATVLAALGVGILALLMAAGISGQGLGALVGGYVEQNLETTLALYQGMGMPEENIRLITESLDRIRYVLVRLLPAMAATTILVVTWANLIMGRALLVRRGLGPLPPYQPIVDSLRQYKNPLMRSQKDRGKLIKKRPVEADTEVLFFVGCALEFDPTSQFIAKATASILDKAGVKWGTLGDREVCCGMPAFDVGCEDEFASLAKENLQMINALNVKTIVTSCPGCATTMKYQWTRYGELKPKVMHVSEFCAQLLREGRLKVKKEFRKKVTIHDPCWLGRYAGVYEEPREVLRAIPGLELVEMERNRKDSYCCGAGGGVMISFPEWAAENATSRLEEALETGAQAMVVPSCPECYLNFDVALHGYAAAVKLFQNVWQKAPVAVKFLDVAHKLSAPFLKRRKKVDIDVLDQTALLDQVT